MALTEVETAPPETEQDAPQVAHVVLPYSAFLEALTTGTPCTALCGYVFVPASERHDLPVCQACDDAYRMITGRSVK